MPIPTFQALLWPTRVVRLAQLMIEFDLDGSDAAVHEVKRIDNDFFVDE